MKAETEADRHPVMKEGDAGKITGICFSFFFFFFCVSHSSFLTACLNVGRSLLCALSIFLPSRSFAVQPSADSLGMPRESGERACHQSTSFLMNRLQSLR